MTDLAETVLTGILTGLAADALWESGKWAWKHREEIAQRLRPPRTIRTAVIDKLGLTDTTSVQTLTGGGIPSLAQAGGGTLTITKDISASWNVRSLVTKDLDARWNVEAPTHSLARRLEELASWYLHVS